MSRSRTFVMASALTGALLAAAGASQEAAAQAVPIPNFGPNPGNLDMLAYSPASAGDDAPLVLVLHGCTQTAASMPPGGFEALADEFGFHLVYPQQERKKTPAQWGDLVRDAFPEFTGPYPRVFVAHGTQDFIVHSDAAIKLDEQWTDVHGIDTAPETVETVSGHTRSLHESNGEVVVESWRVNGMGHAFPIGQDPEHGCGTVAAFFEDRDLCGAYRALKFFGVTGNGGNPQPDAGPVEPDAGPAADAACGVDAAGGEHKGDLAGPGGDDADDSAGCATAGGGGALGAIGLLLALVISAARRRRSARSTLPAPVRGSSGRSA